MDGIKMFHQSTPMETTDLPKTVEEAVALMEALRETDVLRQPPATNSETLNILVEGFPRVFSNRIQDAQELGDFFNLDHELRHYHNARHAVRVLQALQDNVPGITSYCPPGNISLSAHDAFALWHDALYFTKGMPGASEQHSVGVFLDSLRDPTSLFIYDAATVATAILATQHHALFQRNLPRPILLMLDADLCELGTDRYWVNGELIRRELHRDGTPLNNFLIGRQKWLQLMLSSRPHIFYTPEFSKYEEKARTNMELESLAISAILDGIG